MVDVAAWTGLPSSVARMTFGASGHVPFIEQRDQFLTNLVDFFDKADGKETNREFKFADPVAMLKELT